MARLSERLDYILSYQTEGSDDLQNVERELTALEKRGTNVNEITARSREIMAEKAKANKEEAKSIRSVSQQQADLATQQKATNATVRDASIEFELLRFQFDEGRISQEEYEQGLTEIRGRLEDVDVVTMSSIRSMRQVSNEQKKVGQSADSAGRSVGYQARSMGTANEATFTAISALTQLNPQMGTSASTALSLGRSFGSLSASTGGAGNAFKSAIAFLTSPAGLVAAIGLATAGTALWLNHLRETRLEIVNLEKASESLVDRVDEIIESLLETRQLDDSFNMQGLETTLDLTEKIQEAFRQGNEEIGFFQNLMNRYNIFAIQIDQVLGRVDEKNEKILENLKEQRFQYLVNSQLLERINKAQEERLALQELMSIPEIRNLRRQQLMEELEKSRTEETRQQLDNLRDQIDAQDEIIDKNLELAENSLDKLMDDIDKQEEESRQRSEGFLSFEAGLQQMRIDAVRQAGDEIVALNMQRVDRIRQINANEVISERQKFEAIIMINDEYSRRKLEIARQTAQEEKRIREDANRSMMELDQILHEQRVNMAFMAVDSIRNSTQNLLGDSKAMNILIFLAERALAIKQVIMDGIAKASQAMNTGNLLLANPATAALAPNAWSQAVAIAGRTAKTASLLGGLSLFEAGSMAFSSGSGGSGGSSQSNRRITHEFRGASADTSVGTSSASRWPDTVRLTDKAGKFLTTLELERDKSGDETYLVGSATSKGRDE